MKTYDEILDEVAREYFARNYEECLENYSKWMIAKIHREAAERYRAQVDKQQAVEFDAFAWYNGWTKVAIDKYRKENFMTGECELKTTAELYKIFKTESK